MNNCPKCGNPLQVGTESCPICGTNTSASAAPAPAPVAARIPPAAPATAPIRMSAVSPPDTAADIPPIIPPITPPTTRCQNSPPVSFLVTGLFPQYENILLPKKPVPVVW